jgi:excisionase family DNA binding protein
MSNAYLSTTQYAKNHGISKMQVIRLIRAGKIVAQRVGNSWMISETENNFHQIEFEKTTSIQKWNKAITAKFHKNVKAQKSKDREIIYARLRSLGLPTERSVAFPAGKFPTKREFEIAVGRIGLPYWISAVPNPDLAELNRLSKLGIYDTEPGWKFINKIGRKEEYKILVSQYPDDTLFKGSLLISKQGSGVGEFISGDRHYIMSMGFTLTDPMLFSQEKILKYSKTITPSKQRHI